jgi:Zn-dependent protease
MRGIAVLLAVISISTVMAGYWSKPDAATCSNINSMNAQLGNPATCSSGPAGGIILLAVVLAIVALILFVIGQARAAGRNQN